MSVCLRVAAMALCSVPFFSPAFAQMAPAAQSSASTIAPATSMDGLLSATEKDIVALAEAMPAEKYAFAPSAGDFSASLKANYTGVRTFGQEVAHMAQGNYMYGAMFSGLKPPVDPKSLSTGVDKTTAVASLKASYAFLHQAVATLTEANAFEHAGRSQSDTRISTLAAGIAHSRDHYGQLVEYLRMNGMIPPASQGRPLANPAKP